jgi:hypothetical protein
MAQQHIFDKPSENYSEEPCLSSSPYTKLSETLYKMILYLYQAGY